MIDSNRPYRRTEIDKISKKQGFHAPSGLIRGGDGIALYIDVYTGKRYEVAIDPYDYEHQIFRGGTCYPIQILTDEQIALVVNCPENVAVTLRCINQSKRQNEKWKSG
jgi:hypothetical protein